MDSLLVDPRIRVHPKRCARIHASKDHGCDYMKGIREREEREADERTAVGRKGGGNGSETGRFPVALRERSTRLSSRLGRVGRSGRVYAPTL